MQQRTKFCRLVAVLLAASCGDRGPTTPTSSPDSNGSTHVRGSVVDTLAQPIAGVRIEVRDGPRFGASTSTDARGAFELVGGAIGKVRIVANRDGFFTTFIDTSWQPGSSAEEVRIVMKALDPTQPFQAGSYTLTVASDATTATGFQGVPCAGFPPDLLRRTYDASISARSYPGADNFLVDLTSPQMTKPPGATCVTSAAFPVVRGCFVLDVRGRFVGFSLENGWGWDWIEEWPGFRYLTISGYAPTSEAATFTETTTTVPFWGSFEYCVLRSPLDPHSSCSRVPPQEVIEYRSCSSTQDTMVFTKR